MLTDRKLCNNKKRGVSRDIFKHFSPLPFLRRRLSCLFWGRGMLKYFVVHISIVCRNSVYVYDYVYMYVCVYVCYPIFYNLLYSQIEIKRFNNIHTRNCNYFQV